MSLAPLQRPLVGVGVIIWRGAQLLVGQRKGSHGTGTYALPGGHLEYGEGFEQCAVREVQEETGIELDPKKVTFAYATNTIFSDIQKQYVTIFVQATVPETTEAQLVEPDKCEGWRWVAWDAIPRPLFTPLEALLNSPFKPLHPTAAAPPPLP